MAAILLIDTSTSEGIVALIRDIPEQLVVRLLPEARQFGEELHLAIEDLLAEATVQLNQLDAIAVVNGPGSYTGLRVGLATAKGLCFALDIPLLAINRLRLLEIQFRKQQALSGTLAVLIPARAGEWFVTATDETGTELLSPQHLPETDWLDWLQKATAKGNVTVAVATDSQKPVDGWAAAALYFPNQIRVVAIQEALYTLFELQSFSNLATVTPYYLKSAYISTSKA